MRKIWFSLSFSGLCSVLWLSGCAQQPSVPSPAASPAAVAKPTPTPAKGDLVIATSNLELAIKEFHNRNHRGALEFIEIARAEVAAAIAKTTDKSKPKIEAVAKDLDSFKAKIEQNDKKADDFLTKTKLVERIGQLGEEQ